jgi:hypothetical protein
LEFVLSHLAGTRRKGVFAIVRDRRTLPEKRFTDFLNQSEARDPRSG